MKSSLGLRRRSALYRSLAMGCTVVLIVVVIWVDIKTQVWSEVVILSGIAAGVVTFLFTALFIDRIIARSEQERWRPVTHLAVTDLMHGLAHSDSEISRGDIRPRYLTFPDGPSDAVSNESLQELLHGVTKERSELAVMLGRWSSFLATNAEAQTFMSHIAEITSDLDAIRDCVMAFESDRTDQHAQSARDNIETYNRRVDDSVKELQHMLDDTKDAD